jgi:hypothetical protein
VGQFQTRPEKRSNLTVTEIFNAAELFPSGPVLWQTDPPETSPGVYVVARVGDANGSCDACELPFRDLRAFNLDLEYETHRWLRNEPIVYVGKTDRSIRKRLGEFRRHECGNKRPHAGGQVVKLLQCDLWVYWSPAPNPCDAEHTMICAFKKQTGQFPFANEFEGRGKRRIRRSN